MNYMRGFTSDALRELFRAGRRQGFIPDFQKGSGHASLVCPTCGKREAFSLSGRGRPHEIKTKIATLRSHGLVWKGRGGEHTAPIDTGVTRAPGSPRKKTA